MLAGVTPHHSAFPIDDCSPRQLSAVVQARRRPILMESRGAVLFTTSFERRIGKEFEQVVLTESHRCVRLFCRIGDTTRRHSVLAAVLMHFVPIADHDEANRDSGFLEFRVEFAQLRERFSKKRSTDVAQPDDERRFR